MRRNFKRFKRIEKKLSYVYENYTEYNNSSKKQLEINTTYFPIRNNEKLRDKVKDKTYLDIYLEINNQQMTNNE